MNVFARPAGPSHRHRQPGAHVLSASTFVSHKEHVRGPSERGAGAKAREPRVSRCSALSRGSVSQNSISHTHREISFFSFRPSSLLLPPSRSSSFLGPAPCPFQLSSGAAALSHTNRECRHDETSRRAFSLWSHTRHDSRAACLYAEEVRCKTPSRPLKSQ